MHSSLPGIKLGETKLFSYIEKKKKKAKALSSKMVYSVPVLFLWKCHWFQQPTFYSSHEKSTTFSSLMFFRHSSVQIG